MKKISPTLILKTGCGCDRFSINLLRHAIISHCGTRLIILQPFLNTKPNVCLKFFSVKGFLDWSFNWIFFVFTFRWVSRNSFCLFFDVSEQFPIVSPYRWLHFNLAGNSHPMLSCPFHSVFFPNGVEKAISQSHRKSTTYWNKETIWTVLLLPTKGFKFVVKWLHDNNIRICILNRLDQYLNLKYKIVSVSSLCIRTCITHACVNTDTHYTIL